MPSPGVVPVPGRRPSRSPSPLPGPSWRRLTSPTVPVENRRRCTLPAPAAVPCLLWQTERPPLRSAWATSVRGRRGGRVDLRAVAADHALPRPRRPGDLPGGGVVEADAGVWWLVNKSAVRPLEVVDDVGIRTVLPPGPAHGRHRADHRRRGGGHPAPRPHGRLARGALDGSAVARLRPPRSKATPPRPPPRSRSPRPTSWRWSPCSRGTWKPSPATTPTPRATPTPPPASTGPAPRW